MGFNFSSGGAAVTGALEQFMVQREAAKRQAMLDAIMQQREERLGRSTEAQIANTAATTASLNASREADQAVKAETLRGLTQNNDLSPYMVNDEVDAGVAKKYPGMVSVTPPQQGAHQGQDAEGVDQYAVTPGSNKFKGTPEQREVEAKRAEREQYLSGLDPESTEARYLTAQTRTGDASLPYQLYADPQNKEGRIVRAGRDGTLQVQDPATGQLRPFGPGDAPFNKTTDQLINEPAPSGGGGNTTVNMGSDAVDMAAWQYLQTGSMPPLGMGASNLRSAILERAAALGKQNNINPQANAASYGADKGALNQITRSLTAISAFEVTAQKNIAQMKAAMNGVSDTGIPILNAPIRELQRMTGSPEVAKYQAAIRVVIPEVARILTQPNLAGQLTDQARHEIESVIRGDATVEQANAVIDLLFADMQNRKASLIAERDALMGGINQRGPAGAGAGAGAETPEQRRERLRAFMPRPR